MELAHKMRKMRGLEKYIDIDVEEILVTKCYSVTDAAKVVLGSINETSK